MGLANYLKMTKRQQVIALLALGWSFRRIEREVGVRRETVSRYAQAAPSNAAKVFPGLPDEGTRDSGALGSEADSKAAKAFPGSASNPAKVFPGSGRSRSAAVSYEAAIVEKLDQGLTLQRIHQDLVEEYGYGHSYESIKRFVRRLEPRKRRAVGIMATAPGEEAQVDFFRGAPTLDVATGQWRRPWVFRMTLSHSRHGYEEAVWDQKLETFLRLHERAFHDLGGVPLIIRLDNLKAGVTRSCLYDPDIQAVYKVFSEHWGFTALPIPPRTPQHNGKQERAGGYVKSNALKARRFDSIEEQNAFLRRWNRTVARLRIHGTTRRQVYTHYEQTDKKTLQPLAAERFAYFQRGTRTVHPDGHVEVDGAFYPAADRLMGADIEVRWDDHLVRLYDLDESLLAVHRKVPAGGYAPGQPGLAEPATNRRAFTLRLLGRCERVGVELHGWATAALEDRGVRALRLIQGVLKLVRKYPREAVLAAASTATKNRLFRYRDLVRILEHRSAREPSSRQLCRENESIRPMTQYTLEGFL
jgi:transposase